MAFGHNKNKNSSRKETAGEIIFDRTVYTGIGFAVNEALSMVMAVELRHFGGKAHFEKAAQWWKKTLNFKDKTKNGITTSGQTRAEDSLEIFTLLAGGTLLVIPMKLMEDHKQKIVKNINHLIDKLPGHHMDAEAVKARDEEVNNALACEAKQTWGSMILGRAVATVNNMFLVKETIFAGDRTQRTKEWSEKYMRKGADALHNMTGGKPGSRLDRMKNSERFKRYAEIVGLETAYTAISSAVMEIASKFIARKKPEPKDPELCAAVGAAAVAVPVAQPAPVPDPDCDCPVKDPKKFAGKFKPAAKKTDVPPASHVEKIAASPDSSPAIGA